MATAPEPRYRVPPLAEILATPRNGLRAVSLFSGCGGSSLGLRWASEFVPAAADTYAANFPTTTLDRRDVREVRGEEILAATGLREGELDLLDGSPPCAAFTLIGKRQAGWNQVRKYSDTKQRTDDLFFEFARLLRELRPRAFSAENVPGLAAGAARGYFKEVKKGLEACGYRVAARILDGQWLGVPQRRRRLFFQGFREDLGLEPVHPAPLRERWSIRDACPWIEEVREVRHAFVVEWAKADGPAPTVLASGTLSKQSSDDADVLARPLDARGQPVWSSPSVRRRFAIPELRALCGFPADFFLSGEFDQQWERLGRAVPPPMTRAVGRRIAAALTGVAGGS